MGESGDTILYCFTAPRGLGVSSETDRAMVCAVTCLQQCVSVNCALVAHHLSPHNLRACAALQHAILQVLYRTPCCRYYTGRHAAGTVQHAILHVRCSTPYCMYGAARHAAGTVQHAMLQSHN